MTIVEFLDEHFVSLYLLALIALWIRIERD